MPSFTITAPDGTVYDIDAPEGTTQEQVLARVQAQHKNRASKPPQTGLGAPVTTPVEAAIAAKRTTAQNALKQTVSQFRDNTRRDAEQFSDDVRVGLANTGIQSYLGARQLFGELTPEQQQVRRMSNAEANRSTTAKIANFAGDTALTLIPAAKAAGAAEKVTSLLPKSMELVRGATSLAAGGAASGLVNTALKPADSREQRFSEAVKDVTLGATLNSALGLGVKGVTGLFKPTVEASELMRQGINPTLAQGADGRFGQFVGGLTSNMMDISKRQGDEVMDAYLRKIAPSVDFSKMTVAEKMGILEDLAQKGYTAALPGKVAITPQDRQGLFNAAKATNPRAKSVEDINQVIGDIFQTAKGTINVSADKVRKYRNDINSNIDRLTDRARKSGLSGEEEEMLTALYKVRERFDQTIRMKGATDEQWAKLQEANKLDRALSLFSEPAATSRGQREINVAKIWDTLADVSGSRASRVRAATEADPVMKELVGPANRVMGDAATYNQERAFKSALWNTAKGAGAVVGGNAVVGPIATPAIGALYGLSALSQTPQGARFLMGGNDWQRAMAETIRKERMLGNKKLINLPGMTVQDMMGNAALQATDEMRGQ